MKRRKGTNPLALLTLICFVWLTVWTCFPQSAMGAVSKTNGIVPLLASKTTVSVPDHVSQRNGFPVGSVYTSTGNLIIHQTDLFVPGKIPIQVGRTYHSNGVDLQELGLEIRPGFYPWQMNYTRLLLLTAAETLELLTSSGELLSFTYDAAAQSYHPPTTEPTLHDRIEYDPENNRFVDYFRDGSKHSFEQTMVLGLYVLAQVRDNNGNIQELSYNEHLQCVRIQNVDNDGTLRNWVDLTYDNVGLLRSVAHGEREVTYDYIDGMLSSVTDLNGHLVEYDYGESGKLVAVRDGENRSFNIRYDRQTGQVTVLESATEAVSFSYDPIERKTEMTDGNGLPTLFSYDQSGRTVSVRNPLGQETCIEYNGSGNVTSVMSPQENVFSMTYDGDHHPLTFTDGEGNTTSFEWDSTLHKPVTVTMPQPLGTVYKMAYDAHGNLIEAVKDFGENRLNLTTTFIRDGFGQVVEVENARGISTFFDYDGFGNRTGLVDPYGMSTLYEYGPDGTLTRSIPPKGEEYAVSFNYDAMGNLLERTDPYGQSRGYDYDAAGKLVSRVDESGGEVRYEYDDSYRLSRTVDEEDQATVYGYDANRNVTEVRRPDETRLRYEYDEANRLSASFDAMGHGTKYARDADGRVIETRDAMERSVLFEYDGNGRKTAVIRSLAGEDLATTFAYDEAGRMVSLVDAEGHETTFEYDALGRLTKETDAMSHTTDYAYDEVGNLSTVTNGAGQTNAFEYDAMDRLVAIDYEVGDDAAFGYDLENGQLALADNGKVGYAYEYDKNNRLVRVDSVSELLATTLTYEYDGAGHMIGMTGPGEEGAFTYERDAKHRVVSLTDAAGNMTSFEYDAQSGTLDKKCFPNGVLSEMEYDPNRRVRVIAHTDPGEPGFLSRFEYERNPLGMVTSVVKTVGEEAETTDYAYDELYRLTNDGTWSYTYDKVGNRTQKIGAYTSTYFYDEANRLQQMVAPAINVEEIYGWDDAGRLTEKVRVEGEMFPIPTFFWYDWDSGDRLLKVSKQEGIGGEVAEWPKEYDPFGKMTRNDSARNEYFLWDGDDLLAAYDTTSGGMSRLYTNGTGIDNRIAVEEFEDGASTSYVYLTDQLMSTESLVGPDKTKEVAYDYDPFGEYTEVISSEEVTDMTTFTGREFDENAELYHYRARWMDPDVGRFISKDPVRSVNPYAYVSNNPTNFVDPLGLYQIITSFDDLDNIGRGGGWGLPCSSGDDDGGKDKESEKQKKKGKNPDLDKVHGVEYGSDGSTTVYYNDGTYLTYDSDGNVIGGNHGQTSSRSPANHAGDGDR